MRGLSQYIQAVPRWRLIVWLIGIAFLLIGGGWPPAGPGVAGLILVAVAVLQWPWGLGAYRRRCAGAASRAALAIETATKRSSEQHQQHLNALRRIPIPDGLAQEAEKLISLIEASGAMHEDRSTPLPERSAALINLQSSRKKIYDKIADHASTPDEQAYRDALRSTTEANDQVTNEEMQESLRILTNLIAYQEQLQPPKHLQSAHESMCRAFREEFAALSKHFAASQNCDTEAVRATAIEYQQAAYACYARLHDLGIRTASNLPRRAV
jgi:hypothetical protein